MVRRADVNKRSGRMSKKHNRPARKLHEEGIGEHLNWEVVKEKILKSKLKKLKK